MKEFEHDVEIIAVVLALRPLIGVQNIFKDERVQAKNGSHLFEEANVLEAVDVDPYDVCPVRRRQEPIQRNDLLLVKVGFAIFAEGDLRLLRVFLPDVDQRAGRETGLGGSFLCGSGHVPIPPGSNGISGMGTNGCKSGANVAHRFRKFNEKSAGEESDGRDFLLTKVSELRT